LGLLIKDIGAVILNWNDTDIVLSSVERLLVEIEQVVVVDNGSTDFAYLCHEIGGMATETGKHPVVIRFAENVGISKARNTGISTLKERCAHIFLLDGDILYVPETIERYHRAMCRIPGCMCVGQHSTEAVKKNGFNGVIDRLQADSKCPELSYVKSGFPMAWTQYGLFHTNLFHDCSFLEDGPFGEPGHGYEDDILYRDIMERYNLGTAVVYSSYPAYYHRAHSGLRQLTDSRTDERRAYYINRVSGELWQWGKYHEITHPIGSH
jgi:glycosyltransferase involved in cell wall biosynthesis